MINRMMAIDREPAKIGSFDRVGQTRDAEQQVPLRQASDVALFISDWFRVSFMVFLSSECRTLMGFQSVGEWKSQAIQAFKSILHLTVRNSLKTQSPIPS